MLWSRSLKPPMSLPLVAASAAALLLTRTRTTTSFTKVLALSMSPPSETRRSCSSSLRRDQPDFAFGLIADVQWADADDGSNFAGTVKRHYRGAFENLVSAVDWWRAIDGGTSGSDSGQDDDRPGLAFVAQLGDLVDGLNAQLGQSHEALVQALEQLDRLGPGCPAINVVGNHEMYNFDREELAAADWLRHGDKEFYRFSPAPGWSVVVLDAYQISLLGHAADDPRRAAAVALLARENPNIRPDGAAGSDWFDGIPPQSYRRRFVPYNGGYGREQLDWFAAELARARGAGERVIVLSHVIIHPEACGGGTMAWDYDEALDIIRAANRGDESDGTGDDGTDDGGENTVVAVLCGHDHRGNYHRDRSGVHHCTFCSPLNKGAAGQAYGLVRVSPTGMEVVGPAVDDLLPAAAGRPPKRAGAHDGSAGSLESIFLPFDGWTGGPTAVAAEERGKCIPVRT